jgi:hypothetical protein
MEYVNIQKMINRRLMPLKSALVEQVEAQGCTERGQLDKKPMWFSHASTSLKTAKPKEKSP